MMGNPLMNDASLSQTAGRAKTRQPGLMVEPTQIVLSSFHPETLLFPDAEIAGFQSGNEQFFLLARKSSNYEEAYINTLTNNCED